jgi:hypothetical protein
MSAWESNASDEVFDTETGSPEIAERSEPVKGSAAPTPMAVTPGLVCVATISLASPPRESGVCRCAACRKGRDDFDAWFD